MHNPSLLSKLGFEQEKSGLAVILGTRNIVLVLTVAKLAAEAGISIDLGQVLPAPPIGVITVV